MIKKLPLLCASLATAGVLAALGVADQKEQMAVTVSAERPADSAARRLVKLGQTRTIPLRAPEGGYTAPVTFAPTQEQFNECTIVDVNDDGTKWAFREGTFYYAYNTSEPADDWCILPAMNLSAGAYKVTYTCYTRSDKENFSICLGTSTDPGSMTIPVAEKIDYSNSSEVTETRTVELPASGEWHVGLHAFSPKNRFGIYIKNISIVKLDPTQPKSPGLSLEADALDCTLTVTIPSENIGGEPLAASEVEVTVDVDGTTLDNGIVSGAPGQEKTVIFSLDKGGVHTISAVASYDNGGETLVSEASVIERKFSKRQPVPTPMGYVFAPDQDEFDWCTVINNNNDNKTWEYCISGFPATGKTADAAFLYVSPWTTDGDDWLILPAFDGTRGGAHKVSFNVGTKYYNEGLEVYFGYEPTVEALSSNKIWADNALKLDDTFETREAMFTTEAGRDFYVAFRATSLKNSAYLYLQNICVDVTDGSAPLAPVLGEPEFDGGDGTITVTLPARNLDGVEMDASTVVYVDVTLDGAAYGEILSGAPGQEKVLSFSDLPLGFHNVTATSYVMKDGEKVGNRSSSVDFKCRISSNFAYQLPVELTLDKNVYDNFLVIDANGDGNTWTGEEEYFQYKWVAANGGDDWFITPAIEVKEGGLLYDIAVSAKSSNSFNAEKMEVFVGREQSVEGMSIELVPATVISNTDWQEFGNTIQLPQAGRYYVGVRCISDANKYYLHVGKLTFKESEANDLCPAAVTGLAGDGLETGELLADITFAFPTVNMGGEALDPETELTATVSGETDSKPVTGKPGEPASVRLACPQGKSVVSVKVSSEAGVGKAVSIEVNCGLDRPTAPVITALTVSEDNMSVKIDYEAITTGVSGGHVNPGGMDYYLWEWDEDDEDWYQIDVTSALTMTYQLDSPRQPLVMLTLGLQAYNGMNSGSAMTAFNVVLGVPQTLPVAENFEGGELHHMLGLGSSLDSDYAPQWWLKDPSTVIEGVESQDGGYVLYGHTSFNRGDTYIYLPKFSTEGIEDAEIEFSTYHHPASARLTLLAGGYGMEQLAEIGKVEVPQTTEGWKKFVFPLPAELQGRKWVDARLHVDFIGGSSVIPMFDHYIIRSASQSGLGAVAETPLAGSVEGKAGSILISGFDGQTARVFAPAGQQVAQALLPGSSVSVAVPSGIYLVAIGDKTFKVAVR